MDRAGGEGLGAGMDEQALESIRKRINEWITVYWVDVYQYALSLVKKDSGKCESADVLASEAFEETFFYLLNQPEMEIREPKKWLCKAVLNRYRNSTRGKLRQSTDSLEQIRMHRTADSDDQLMELPGRGEDEPEHVLEDIEREQETKELVRRAIVGAPFDWSVKRVLVLSLIEGYSDREIARMCHIPFTVVKRYVRDGVGRVRMILEHISEQEEQD